MCIDGYIYSHDECLQPSRSQHAADPALPEKTGWWLLQLAANRPHFSYIAWRATSGGMVRAILVGFISSSTLQRRPAAYLEARFSGREFAVVNF